MSITVKPQKLVPTKLNDFTELQMKVFFRKLSDLTSKVSGGFSRSKASAWAYILPEPSTRHAAVSLNVNSGLTTASYSSTGTGVRTSFSVKGSIN